MSINTMAKRIYDVRYTLAPSMCGLEIVCDDNSSEEYAILVTVILAYVLK